VGAAEDKSKMAR